MRVLIVALLLFAAVTVLSIWYWSSDRSAPLRLPSSVQESTLFESDAVIAIDPGPFLATIGGRDIVFYAIDLETGREMALTPERADERHVPWSSFKLPNLMIALETGVSTTLDDRRAWDRTRRPAEDYWPESWQRDHTLASAFQQSAAWYFQDVALEVGAETYRGFLSRFGYGNADVPDGSDDFWLGGRLRVSTREQAQFLARALKGELGLKAGSFNAAREVSVLGEKGGFELHGKSGSGPSVPGAFDGTFEGWLVGWVERPDAMPVTFALYVEGPSFGSIVSFRRDMTELLLMTIGALPEDWN